MRQHKEMWKQKFKLIFSFRPGSEREGLIREQESWISRRLLKPFKISSIKNFRKSQNFNFTTFQRWYPLYVMLCMIWYHLCSFKNVKNTNGGELLKVTIFHGRFSQFLNCTSGTRSRKAHIKNLEMLQHFVDIDH